MPQGISWEMHGEASFKEAIAKLTARCHVAAAGFAKEGAELIVKRAKKHAVEGGRHAAGTPTPATQGSGPAKISGDLQRSIGMEGHGTEYRVGPSVVYGRRVELEYNYPFMQPSYDEVLELLPELELKWFRRAIHG